MNDLYIYGIITDYKFSPPSVTKCVIELRERERKFPTFHLFI